MNSPNSPCECGSGKKQKKCHPFGAPMYGPEKQPETPEERKRRKQDAQKALAVLSVFGGF